MDVEAIKKYFDEKILHLTETVVGNSSKKAVVLKGKGNQAQFDFCTEVQAALQRAEELIRIDKKPEALQKIGSAKILVEKRMKLVRIADKSDLGWNTVDEYVSDDLASDSDDEKRLRKAEARAEQKRKKRDSARLPNKKPKVDFYASRDNMPSTSRRFQNYQPSGRQFHGNASTDRQFFPARKAFRTADRCFGCGKEGHWRSFCPENNQSSTRNPGEPKLD